MRKISVCFTIDEDLLKMIKKEANKKTKQTGVNISRSLIVNNILKEHYNLYENEKN